MQNAELLGCAGFILNSDNIYVGEKIEKDENICARYMPKGINTEAGAGRKKA